MMGFPGICVRFSAKLLLALTLGMAAPALAQEPQTFAIEGFRLGARVSAEELEPFDCVRSRWTGAERECRKKKEWKQVSASTSLFLDQGDRLQMLRQKFDKIPMNEKTAEEVIAANSKRFDMEPKRIVKQLGPDKVIVASWGNVALSEIGIQTRLATIQGKQPDDLLLMDLIDDIERSARDVLPIYNIEGRNGAVWTFFIRAGAPGWAMARIISRGKTATR